MNGPQHYLRSEELLRKMDQVLLVAASPGASKEMIDAAVESANFTYTAALAHATLALVASRVNGECSLDGQWSVTDVFPTFPEEGADDA